MGPGDHLHDLIRERTGREPDLSCNCRAWIRRMNTWGPRGCRKKMKLIVAKLAREARSRPIQWQAVPVAKDGTLLNSRLQGFWRGTLWLPGAGVFLHVYIERMVTEAISRSEQ